MDQHTPPPPTPGDVTQLAPGLRRVIAPNPSPMTYWGTNSFLLGEGEVTLIDPGPDSAAHRQSLLAALAPGECITRILVTHAHRDHSEGAPALSDITGAPVLAFGNADAGRAPHMQALVDQGLTGGGEGVDTGFTPDDILTDGAQLTLGGTPLTAIWTPGHMAGHLSFQWRDMVFTGDLVMAWSSSLVSPPDGDVAAFIASCEKLAALSARTLLPAHGPAVDAPKARLAWLIAHRKSREAEILAALGQFPLSSIAEVTRKIYTETPSALLPAAERNVFAHLIDLTNRGHVEAKPTLSSTARFLRSAT